MKVPICFIPRLHDQAGSTSWLDKLLYVSWTRQLGVCLTFARCLLDVWLMIASCRLCFMHASYLLDVRSTFVWCLLDVCSIA